MARNLFPGGAFVPRNKKTAAGTPALSAPRMNFQRPDAGEKDARIVRIHGDVRTATVLVREQHALPGFAAVSGAKDAAIRLRSIRVTKRAS